MATNSYHSTRLTIGRIPPTLEEVEEHVLRTIVYVKIARVHTNNDCMSLSTVDH